MSKHGQGVKGVLDLTQGKPLPLIFRWWREPFFSSCILL